MIKCSEGCTPCCDFCIYAVHEILYDEEIGGDIKGGPIHCDLHPDEDHDILCESCSYCEDFHCFRAKDKIKDTKRAKRRHTDFKKAIRKRNITKHWQWTKNHEYYSNLHQYSKNKIHCSCPMCSQKTNNKHKPLWEAPMNWPIKDKKRLEEMREQAESIYERDSDEALSDRGDKCNT